MFVNFNIIYKKKKKSCQNFLQKLRPENYSQALLCLTSKKSFMAPFYGWVSTVSRLEPLRGGSLLFTTKFPETPGTDFIDLGRMKKAESTLEPPSRFEHGTLGLGIQRLNH